MKRQAKNLADYVPTGCTVSIAAHNIVIPFYFFLNMLATDDGLADDVLVSGHYDGRVALMRRQGKTATVYFVRFSDDVADVLFGMEN